MTGDRWRPLRAGIVNLYEYADQELQLSGGRLLLRGHNTSGKTKALELLLPFCLDGDIHPRKLDPFASNAKEMHWNLIGCGDHEQRTGYVWLEFARLSAEAGPARVTCGIGLKANRGSRDVRRWYWIARDRRVGDDLRLTRHDREPISRAELTAALGDDGEVLDTATEYRRRLDDLLFGFGSDDGYRTMLRLMLELRRPHLSKTLDPDAVAQLLSAGLPPVDEALMRRLAGGLEQLDALEHALARLRETRERLGEFHQRAYRGYLRAVVRERGERVRRAHTRFDAAAETVRETRATLSAAEADAERLAAERAETDGELARLEGELEAVVTSAAWSSIAEVQALGERAVAERRAAHLRLQAAEEAAADATALEAERIAAEAVAGDDRTAAQAGLDEVVALAELAGLAGRATALAQQLRADVLEPATWEGLTGELARDWGAVLGDHAEQLERCRRAAEAAAAAREAERRAADRLAAARAKLAEADAQLQEARTVFDGAMAEWAAGLVELRPEAAEVEAARTLGGDGRDPRGALMAAVNRARASIAAARAELAVALRAAEAEIASIDERIEAVEAERDDDPPAGALERTSREGRPGAPLWQLVEFADELASGEPAALEAALQATGLLDAWILPDGGVLDADILDAALAGGPAVDGPTLADVFVPTAGPVAGDVVRGVLARVPLRDAAGAELALVVGRDGSYAAGPLRGRAAKPVVEYVGVAARAARRARLLAELRERREEERSRAGELRDADARLITRGATVDAELEACPQAEPVASALRLRATAAVLEGHAGTDHDQALAEARWASDAEVAADAERRDHALAHGLPVGLDWQALRARSEAAARLVGAVRGVAAAWRTAARAAAHVREVAARHDSVVAVADERAALARSECAEADRVAAERAVREQALGDDAAALRIRHEEVTGAQRDARDRRRALEEAEREAVRSSAEARHDVDDAEQAHDAAREERDAATARFAALGSAGVLGLVAGDAAPPDAALAGRWPMSRVLEVARATATDVRSASSMPGELGQEVMRRVQVLDRELAEADLGAYVTRADGDLLLVRITDEAGDRGLGDILEALAGDIAERERLLTAEERRVFGDALVQEIADHLRTRIRAVHDRVSAMNAVLRRSPTAAGKVVQLEWRTLDDDTGDQRETVQLLRQAARWHGEETQRKIVGFFRRRVEHARAGLALDAHAEPMAEILGRAFDYRQWHAFGLLEEREGTRERLTARRHAVGSGGEQSVLIHLPLFAAAAALYGDSPAPRLVMLDEALSGIDDDTRERVLAATVAFDLDLVMTSHELWGTYRSVPSLQIYQLHREQGSPGVHAIPFRWDGEVLHELEQAELSV